MRSTFNIGYSAANLMLAASAFAMLAADDSAASSFDTDAEEFSLADLADLDVSDIAEIRFETLAQMVGDFKVTTAELSETTNKDNEKRFVADFAFEVVDVKAVLTPGVSKDSLIGKTHKERLWINPGAGPEKVAEAIGRLRAFISDMGCESAGKLGVIVDGTLGHVFSAKITHQKDKDDKSIVYARMKFDAKKK